MKLSLDVRQHTVNMAAAGMAKQKRNLITARVVPSAKITTQVIASCVSRDFPKKKLAMNVESRCAQKAVKFAKSELPLKHAPIVLIQHTAVAGT